MKTPHASKRAKVSKLQKLMLDQFRKAEAPGPRGLGISYHPVAGLVAIHEAKGLCVILEPEAARRFAAALLRVADKAEGISTGHSARPRSSAPRRSRSR